MHQPYVPAEKNIREASLLAIVLGTFLSIIMAAANTYLGLFAGMTVSASIPAAVISMAILKGVLKRGTILENNIVQTMASSGEALAAGVIFTVPALVITEAWHGFHFWPTSLIAMAGGVLGVLFMIPLRRAIVIEEKTLTYPEGVACAEILKSGDCSAKAGKGIFLGILVGAMFKIIASGFHILKEDIEFAFASAKSIFYVGTSSSLALLSVGYIVGPNIGSLIFLGGALAWIIGIPVYCLTVGLPEGVTLANPMDGAWTLWSTQIRYIGVGAMSLGGLTTLFSCRVGIMKGVQKIIGFHPTKESETLRTDRELRRRVIIPLIALMTVLVYFVYKSLTGDASLSLTATVLMVIATFFFVAVASYIVGLVGSTNSPVSGMTICSLLFAAAILLLFGYSGKPGVIAALGISGIACCAICTSGDICQDLKTGYLVGATPRKQQWVQLLGTIVPSFFFAGILTMLHETKGIGIATQPGVEPLAAPQAMLFASLARAFFLNTNELPWNMFWIGVAGAAVIVILDEIQKKRNGFRLHVMAVAVGMYLPLSIGTPMLLGGLVHALIRQNTRARGATAQKETMHKGILIASGLIAGESLMGILIAAIVFSGFTFLKLPSLPMPVTAALYLFFVLVFYRWILGKRVNPLTPS